MKTKVFLALLPMVFLTGCWSISHTCPPPEQSMQCFPLCIKKKNDISRYNAKNWAAFKTYRPLVYRPVGIPQVDNIGIRVAVLSSRITNEVIIPYVEVDKDGLIEAYYEFNQTVKTVMEQRKCSVREAVDLVRKDWERTPQGKVAWAKLHKMMPILKTMRADQQIAKLTLIIAPQIPVLIREFDILSKRITNTRDKKEKRRLQLKIFAAGAQITPTLLRMKDAIGYLWALKADQRAQDKEMDEYLQSINDLGKDNL